METDPIKDEFIEHFNHTRADRATVGLRAYLRTRGELLDGYETEDDVLGFPHFHPEGPVLVSGLRLGLTDLICDLMHAAQRAGIDPAQLLAAATTCHTEEQTEP